MLGKVSILQLVIMALLEVRPTATYHFQEGVVIFSKALLSFINDQSHLEKLIRMNYIF